MSVLYFERNGSFFGYGAENPVFELPPGIYAPDSGLVHEFEPLKWETDDLFRFNEGPAVDALLEIQTFWERAPLFRSSGLATKRSILLSGPPGTGKSCVAKQVMEGAVALGAVCLFCDEVRELVAAVQFMKRFEPGRRLVLMLEDVDRFDATEQLLSLLDGQLQVEHAAVLLTTNHIERMPPRMVNRPGRIDRIIEVGPPSEANRAQYLSKLYPGNPDHSRWVRDSEGLSLAHLRELVVGVMVMGSPYEEVLGRLLSMNNSPEPATGPERLNEILSMRIK